MIYETLELENYGAYGGRQRLQLSPEPARPVILIGGHNGAGKTTVLEAFLLCLHGHRSLWPAISKAEYGRKVAERLHRPPGRQGQSKLSVRLTLTRFEAGLEVGYSIERSFKVGAKGRLRETLTVLRDGEKLPGSAPESDQAFLDDLMPPGLARLFVFDGEKIQSLADDETGRELRDAVRRMTGLDVLGRLRKDLTRYATGVAADEGEPLTRKRRQAQAELEAAHSELERARTGLADLKRQRHSISEEAATARQRFIDAGGAIALTRAEIERDLARARAQLAASEEQLRQLVVGLLPLAVDQALARRVAERLRREQSIEGDRIVRERIEAARTSLARRLSVRSKSAGTVAAVIEATLTAEVDSQPIVHQVTEPERARMLLKLDEVSEHVPKVAGAAARKFKRALKKRAQLERSLERAPEPSEVAPLLEAVQELARRIGALDEEVRVGQEQIRALEHKTVVAERSLRTADEAWLAAQVSSEKAGLALTAAAAAAEFEEQTATAKIAAVELASARFFNRLSRKGQMLSKVSIDRESFVVRLTRWDGSEMSNDRLSAGERQLLAVAVLWALAFVSGRPLPIVIDTPLARLDSEHRQRLLDDYLPAVSHQVIVLSTDTEIDQRTFEQLRPVVARSYLLEHEAGEVATAIRPGYFSREERDAG